MESAVDAWPGGVARGLALALRGLGVQREELRESVQRLQRERRRVLSGAAPGPGLGLGPAPAPPRESCRWSAEVLLLLREPASGALQQIRYASEGGDGGGGGGGVYRSRLELSPWISRKRLARRSAGTADQAIVEEVKPTQVGFFIQSMTDPKPDKEKPEERPCV